MPGSNSETLGRFCDGLGNNIMVQYSVGPIITFHGRIRPREYVDRLGNQVYLMIQTLFPNNDAVFQDDSVFKTCMSPFEEGLLLYWRQKVVQHHINKEMCTVSAVFPLFCAAPVCIMFIGSWFLTVFTDYEAYLTEGHKWTFLCVSYTVNQSLVKFNMRDLCTTLICHFDF
jgi:hypothetical protein